MFLFVLQAFGQEDACQLESLHDALAKPMAIVNYNNNTAFLLGISSVEGVSILVIEKEKILAKKILKTVFQKESGAGIDNFFASNQKLIKDADRLDPTKNPSSPIEMPDDDLMGGKKLLVNQDGQKFRYLDPAHQSDVFENPFLQKRTLNDKVLFHQPAEGHSSTSFSRKAKDVFKEIQRPGSSYNGLMIKFEVHKDPQVLHIPKNEMQSLQDFQRFATKNFSATDPKILKMKAQGGTKLMGVNRLAYLGATTFQTALLAHMAYSAWKLQQKKPLLDPLER